MALEEITLVFFTTLAPSGIIAFIIMAIPKIFFASSMSVKERISLDHFLSLPIVVTMVGLVASATHLGNPANALYIISGFGRSPLSNEVVCGVIFLGTAGVYWLVSFSESEGHLVLRRLALGLICALGICFLVTISFAYDTETILSWRNPLVPLSIVLNAFAGGPLLASLGFRLAGFQTPDHRYGRILVWLSSVAFILDLAVYICWGFELPSIQNSVTVASELVPYYQPAVLVFAMLGVGAISLGVKANRAEGHGSRIVLMLSPLLMLAGIFVMRFVFYMMFMTVGV